MSGVYTGIDRFAQDNKTAGLAYCEDISVLSESIRIKNKVIHNRLVCQAMEGCDGTASGLPDELTERRYLRLARGGAGLIWFEATAVMEEARANPRQLYITKDNVDGFKRLVETIKETGIKANGYEPVVIMQATHSGRYSKPNGTPEPIIAYNNSVLEKNSLIDKSRIITDDKLDLVKEKLIGAAELASRAGFDGVDIKSCHRYLLSELLSAYNRGGKYAGSYENRTRMLRESIAGAMQLCPSDFIVTTRLNAYDGYPYPDGFGVSVNADETPDLTEPKRLLKDLLSLGVELVNITMGNPYFNPHINRPYAVGAYEAPEHPLTGVRRMLEGTGELQSAVPDMKIICSALSFLGVAAPNVAAGYINSGCFSFAGFGRQIFAYPDFANDILKAGELNPSKCCIACSKCTEIMRCGGTTGCVIRDSEVYMPIYKKYCLKK